MRHKAQVAGVVTSWLMRWKPTRYLIIAVAMILGAILLTGFVTALAQAL